MAQKEPAYRFLEHTTDAEIEAFGSTLGEAFQNAALALEDTMVDVKTIATREKFSVELRESDKEALLYSWLEWLIVQQETRGLLFSKFECHITESGRGLDLRALAWGEKFDLSSHEQKTAIKAPTFHAMSISEETAEGRRRIKLHFLLDH
jgi:SHS2 domain-containing protein